MVSLSQSPSPFCFSAEQYANDLFKTKYKEQYIVDLNKCFRDVVVNTDKSSRGQIITWLNGCDKCWLDNDREGTRKNKALWDPSKDDESLKKCYKDTQANKKTYDAFARAIKKYNGGEFLSFATK